jgi:hypothetical protein
MPRTKYLVKKHRPFLFYRTPDIRNENKLSCHLLTTKINYTGNTETKDDGGLLEERVNKVS